MACCCCPACICLSADSSAGRRHRCRAHSWRCGGTAVVEHSGMRAAPPMRQQLLLLLCMAAAAASVAAAAAALPPAADNSGSGSTRMPAGAHAACAPRGSRVRVCGHAHAVLHTRFALHTTRNARTPLCPHTLTAAAEHTHTHTHSLVRAGDCGLRGLRAGGGNSRSNGALPRRRSRPAAAAAAAVCGALHRLQPPCLCLQR
jgi:hypothetical protein